MCYSKNAMKTIRASDIGSYIYCARAWWYQQQGVESSNQAEMSAGTEIHRLHGRKVLASGLLQALGLLSLLAALALLVSYCTASLF